MKSSSRAGRFKTKLVSDAELKIEAPKVKELLAPMHDLLRLQKITPEEFTGIFLILSLSVRYPGNWLGAKRPSLGISHQLNISLSDFDFEPNIKKRLANVKNLGELFNNFALKSTPEAVNRAMLSWSNGSYPLELMFRIPNPREVLEQQKNGRRCLTVLIHDEYLFGRDYLSFTMHDLIHADHFYHNNESYQGQLGFYGLLHKSLCAGFFRELMSVPGFQAEFEYLISDMNAYAIHLMKCLKSAMIHYGSKEIFERWVSDSPVKSSLLLLNSKSYDPHAHDHLILNWLSEFQVVTLK